MSLSPSVTMREPSFATAPSSGKRSALAVPTLASIVSALASEASRKRLWARACSFLLLHSLLFLYFVVRLAINGNRAQFKAKKIEKAVYLVHAQCLFTGFEIPDKSQTYSCIFGCLHLCQAMPLSQLFYGLCQFGLCGHSLLHMQRNEGEKTLYPKGYRNGFLRKIIPEKV